MNHLPLRFLPLLPILLAGTKAPGQTVAIFPDEYAAVAEGPFNSPNYPLAFGTSRVQCLYEAMDVQVPSGHQITKLGFRQDATLTTMDAGRTLQLEVRMGYSTYTAASLTTTFDANYASTPVTVFGPAAFLLPNLRDSLNPLANGQFFLTLTTPFPYVPAGQNLIVEYRVFGTSAGGAQFNYRLDRADFYAPITNGNAGCPHSGGPSPVLTVAPTRPGLSYTATMTTGPQNSPGLLAINVGTPLVPAYPLTAVFAGINPVCTGQVSPIGLVTLGGNASATGTASWTFLIPNNPAFADFPISSQALFLDFFAPGSIVVSNGAQVVTGANPRTTILHAQGAPTALTTGAVNRNYCPVAFFEHQ